MFRTEDFCKYNLFPKILSRERIIFYYFSFKGASYIPIDIGYVAASVKVKIGNKYKFLIKGHFSSQSEDKAQESILKEIEYVGETKPKAVFFFVDNAVWSKLHAVRRAKKIASSLKEKYPGLYIGIQSSKFRDSDITDLFSSGSFDCLIGNYPERSFLFINKILKKNPIPGVIYDYDKEETARFIDFHGSPEDAGEKNLDDYLPSPYLTHALDDFLSKNNKKSKKQNLAGFIYSSLGCRFGCYYCARSVKFEKVRFFSAKRFYDEIEYLNSNFKISLFFILDDAFVFSKKRLEEFSLEFEKRKEKLSNLANIRLFIMSRIELLDEEIIKLLKGLNVVFIQIGLQTTNPNLQLYMNRNDSTNKFTEVSLLLKRHGIKLFLDIIVGLPGDSIDYFKKTLDFAIKLSPQVMQVKQLYLNSGTLFYAKQKEYGIKTSYAGTEDFSVPFVTESIGNVNKEYFKGAYGYTVDVIKKHPEISWRLLMQNGNYLTPGVNDFIF